MPQQVSARGRFVWHELMTDDPDAAIAFYSKVVGWTITPWANDPSYRQWTAGGKPVGGLMRLPAEGEQPGTPPHWLFYLGVSDAAATARQAVARGGRVLHGPVQMADVGTWAVVSDPQGAVFAILQASHQPPLGDAPPRPGEFSWHELLTTDWRAAWDFYQALFGWEKTEAMEMGPMGLYQMFGWKGKSVGGMFNQPPEVSAPPHWLSYAMVPNADAAARRVAALGGQVMNGPMEVPGGDRIAQCLDPQGAAFAVHSTAQVVVARPARPRKPAPPPKRAQPKKAKAARKAKAGKPKRKPVKKAARKRR